ncbi:MAG: hypothetical protein ACJ8J7_01445 [Sulfurifustaceae bacterium]
MSRCAASWFALAAMQIFGKLCVYQRHRGVGEVLAWFAILHDGQPAGLMQTPAFFAEMPLRAVELRVVLDRRRCR